MEGIPGFFPASTRILNVCLRKRDFPDADGFQGLAWRRLIRGFEQLLQARDSLGLIMADYNSDPTIKKVLREMRSQYPMGPPTYEEDGVVFPRIERVVEDVIFRDSRESRFIQAADAIAHCLYRQEFPKSSLKKYNVDRFFGYLQPALYLEMNPNDPQGIVRS